MGGRTGPGTSVPPGGLPVKVTVDPSKCQGHARCFALCPEIFDVDDYGQSSVRSADDVPVELEERVRLAVSNCPEFAIAIVE